MNRYRMTFSINHFFLALFLGVSNYSVSHDLNDRDWEEYYWEDKRYKLNAPAPFNLVEVVILSENANENITHSITVGVGGKVKKINLSDFGKIVSLSEPDIVVKPSSERREKAKIVIGLEHGHSSKITLGDPDTCDHKYCDIWVKDIIFIEVDSSLDFTIREVTIEDQQYNPDKPGI